MSRIAPDSKVEQDIIDRYFSPLGFTVISYGYHSIIDEEIVRRLQGINSFTAINVRDYRKRKQEGTEKKGEETNGRKNS